MPHKQVNLRKSLAKRQLQNHIELNDDRPSGWSGHMDIWEEGLRAIAAGWRAPERLKPVVLGEGMFTTPEMATGMSETPKVVKTSWCEEDGKTKSTDPAREVVICEVPGQYWDVSRTRAKEMTYLKMGKCVWLDDQPFFATVVYSMKEEWEEDNKQPEHLSFECILIGGEKGFP